MARLKDFHRQQTTTSCGLDPRVKGRTTKRLETTTSCHLDLTVKGHPTERPETTKSCGPKSTNVLI
jgi:hypothetical protein